MNFWNALVIIVAIVAFANIQMTKHRARGERGNQPPQPGQLTSQREAELLREVEDLRERVKVLERIATDERQSRSIAAEIEALRDK